MPIRSVSDNMEGHSFRRVFTCHLIAILGETDSFRENIQCASVQDPVEQNEVGVRRSQTLGCDSPLMHFLCRFCSVRGRDCIEWRKRTRVILSSRAFPNTHALGEHTPLSGFTLMRERACLVSRDVLNQDVDSHHSRICSQRNYGWNPNYTVLRVEETRVLWFLSLNVLEVRGTVWLMDQYSR